MSGDHDCPKSGTRILLVVEVREQSGDLRTVERTAGSVIGLTPEGAVLWKPDGGSEEQFPWPEHLSHALRSAGPTAATLPSSSGEPEAVLSVVVHGTHYDRSYGLGILPSRSDEA